MKALLIGLAAATTLATGAFAQNSPPMQCFASREIDGSRTVDDSTINFKVRGDIYQAKFLGSCPNLRNSTGGYTMTLRGGDRICGARDLDITVNDPGGVRCFPQSLRRLTPAEAAALPRKEKP